MGYISVLFTYLLTYLLTITLQNALGGVRSVDKAINGFTDDDSGRRRA